MATKFQLYAQMAERQAEQVTRQRAEWTRFLDTAARLYKYPFAEQLMIYSQRPEATACAPIELWNDPMHRWVRRGSRGIALIDDSGERPRLKYVFDISDTEPAHENARRPYLWEMRPEHEAPVMAALSQNYDGVEGNLNDALYNIATQLVREYYEDNDREIGYSAEGSFLEDFDEYNLGVSFRAAATVSVAYSLMSRCGLDTDAYFEDEDFQPIFDFNTVSAVYALGTAVSDLSQQVLREIGAVIKQYERQRAVNQALDAERSDEHERSHLQPQRGLSAAQSGPDTPAGSRERDPGQVWQAAPELSQAAPGHILQFPSSEREAVPPPVGNGGNSQPAYGAADGRTDAEESAPGQESRPDGLDGPYEQPASAGGGSDTPRADLHLNEEPAAPPEQEEPVSGGISLPESTNPQGYSQVENTLEPPAVSAVPIVEALRASSITAEEVDAVLRDGGNESRSVLRIAAYFMKNKSPADNADFLRREYVAKYRHITEGGKGFRFGNDSLAVWFKPNGITLGRGDSALRASDRVEVSWEQAAVRIRELLEAGQYISGDLLDEAIPNEHRELAERLLFLYRDDFRDFREMPEGWRSERGGFPDDARHVAEFLGDQGELGEYSLLLERLAEDVAALSTEPDAPKRFWHDPHRMLEDVRDAGIRPHAFPVREVRGLAAMRFITQDEVDAFLTKGSNIEASKYRIFSFFLQGHTPKEQADFIKNEYGNGGGSHALGGADDSWYDGLHGKLKLTRGGLSEPYDTVELNWNAAAKRVGKLIAEGRYMTRADLDRIPEYERQTLAREVTSFYYGLPGDIPRPYADSGYFDSASQKSVRELLDNPAKVEELLAAMNPILEGTHPDDRYYESRRTAFDSLTAFRDGSYTLFPGRNSLPMPEAAAKPLPAAPPAPVQLSLFDFGLTEMVSAAPLPVLPGVEQQRTMIQANTQQDEQKQQPAITDTISQEEADALIGAAVENAESRVRIGQVFSENPRSREAAQVLRAIYAPLAFTMPRTDGAEGYMGLLGEEGGVHLSKGAPAASPLSERPPAVTQFLPWGQLHKRVAELAQAGCYLETPEQAYQSPRQHIAYQQGDSIDAVSADGTHVQLVIDRVDEAYVYYTMPSVPDQEPVEMFRSRFEDYLDDGRFSIMEPGAVLPEAPPKPSPAELSAATGRPYAAGDMVFLEQDAPYIIHSIDREVHLYHAHVAADIPPLRSESFRYFEHLLRRNPKNAAITGFLAADLSDIHPDVHDVLADSLLTRDSKRAVAELLSAGTDNSGIAAHLAEAFPNVSETFVSSGGYETDYFTQPRGIQIEAQDRQLTKTFVTWEETAAICRSLYHQGLEGFHSAEQEAEKTAERKAVQEPEDDILTPEEVAQLRERLQNPTPEDEARIDGMLAFAERAASEYEAELGLTPEPAASADAIHTLAEDISLLFEDTAGAPPFDETEDFDLAAELENQLRAGEIGQAEELLRSLSSFRTHDAELEAQADQLLERLHALNRALPEEPAQRTEQEILDDALRVWNGHVESKVMVYQYVRDFPRARDTADFLKTEFADYAEDIEDFSAFPVALPDGTEEHLPWPKVQRRIAQLIEAGAFLNPDEMTLVEREYDFDSEEPAELETVAGPQQDLPRYQEGDTVFLEDDREFRIDRIGDREISLQDMTFAQGVGFPIFRAVGITEFDQLLQNNPRNAGLFEPQAETEQLPDLPPASNYRITDDHLGEGGPKARFAANIAAIRLLKQLEAEARPAVQAEHEILSRYVGWGGLSQAFDAGNEGWQKEYTELKTLLTPDEYEKARESVLNAHYTPPIVIRAIYDAVARMGFKTGNVLEPSCGVGHFFGLLPEGMRGSRLYGVELDDLSARISATLYPGATIMAKGFEKTSFPDSFFDLAVGNVPFGDYKIFDPAYNRHNLFIHDYFIAKTIDKVRAGGVVALITSNGVSGGTFDKRDSKARRYMAERCDLIGAIRLPDNAFKAAAGTDMTTDILFLQKREVPRSLTTDMPDWVSVDIFHEHEHELESGEIRRTVLTLNNYYREHPEMVLGKLTVESGPFGPQLSCKPEEAALSDRLREAVSHLQASIPEAVTELDELSDSGSGFSIAADTHVKNFSYVLATAVKSGDDWYAAKLGQGDVYYRENSRMYRVELPTATLDRIQGMVELRDCVHALIDCQLNDYDDAAIRSQQQKLNTLYDAFTAEYGLINSVANNRAFTADSSYFLLSSLELLDEDGKLERKADMFTKRTIKQKSVVTSVDTASEALAVSIGERARVDLDYMEELSGLSHDKLIEDLRGVIFLNAGYADSPEQAYVTADEYLSGNVREKLRLARAAAAVNPDISINVEALEKAQPKELEAGEIGVRLGSTWIDPMYFQQFMYELLQSPRNIQNISKVNYSAYTGEWQVTGKGRIPYNNIAAHVTYGTERRNAYEIIEDTLNLRDARVYDTIIENGQEKRVLNKKETTLAQQRQELIKQAFKDWIWQDPQRRQRLVRKYNELFNSCRSREYDGSHIVFTGMNPEFTIRSYQANAIARILYGGNTLLAHEVGAGKTFEMVAAAMEGKRLGLCSKSLFAVPNHIIDQIAADFLRLYPSANILVATKRDFEMRNRKKFCAKIATGDYDAVILGHSQLEKIPISNERQERLLQEQLWEVLEGIEEAQRAKGENFTVKQLQRTKKRLEIRLEKIREGKHRDDVVTFEQLGVDRLFIDEAHNFKNLFIYTKMRNVAGLSTTEAQKSNDLFLKCRYMDELTGGKGIIFATGTPVSNSMTEIYTMQRYLQYATLERNNLMHFDCWASIFGETVTAMELAPEGTGYRARTRFSRFHNLPELMGMFSEVADIKTADMLDLQRPDAHFETIVVKPSALQQEMVEALSERAADVHRGIVDPKEDNMLKITSDGRKIGLDQRLIDPLLPDDADSKVNACMENIHRVWERTQSDRLTQLVFCDFSTPNKDGRFNVYDDIRDKLLEKGIPEQEMAFIHDANTDVRKRELFAKVRKGQVRILFGSTFKMGAGTNVQDRLITMHDLDCPWRPADLEQRAGRIVRFGNQNPEVFIYRYATEGTFDAYLWQTVENKQKFISQIMTSKSPVRSCEDVDETALSYAEIKALCSGNPLIKEKIDLDIEVARLRLLKSEHQNQRHRLEDDLLENFPKSIQSAREKIAGLEQDLQRLNAHLPKELPAPAIPVEGGEAKPETAGKTPFAPMTVLGITYAEKEAAGKALLEACKSVKGSEAVNIGAYLGFDLHLSFDTVYKKFRLSMKGALSHSIDMGVDTFGNITRMNNALKVDIPQHLESNRVYLENLNQQVENARKELDKPFAMERELSEKETRLALINAELNIDDGRAPLEAASLGSAQSAKSKPSILESLRVSSHTSKPASRPDRTAENSL